MNQQRNHIVIGMRHRNGVPWDVFKSVKAGLLVCCLASMPVLAAAQANRTVSAPVPSSRVDLFGGYSYIRPYKADINNQYDKPITAGAVASASVYFGRYLGVQAEGSMHPNGPNDCISTAQGGIVGRYQIGRVVPFAHALAGGARLGGPVFQPCTWGVGATAGLGFDYVLHGWGDHIALRPIQADYEYNHVDYGPLVLPGGYAGGLMKMNAYRLSAGVVLRLGEYSSSQPVALSCEAQPVSVYAGEPITVDARTLGLNPRRKTAYTWATTGGKISGTGDSIQVDTHSLPPNTYTVSGTVSQGSKATHRGSCNTVFTVKPFDPPAISCSATPASIHPGETSTISATANSPQGRPLAYRYSATAGQVEGNTATAVLNPAGVTPGSITVTCGVADDAGNSANATTTVELLAPVALPAPQTSGLCSIAFERDKRRPARVDNEAKACLDDIALTLNRQSESKLVIVGSRDGAESPDVAAERAVNTKLYLVREKGIDAGRVLLRSGITDGRKVQSTLVPPGAAYSGPGESFDETSVHPHGSAYGQSHAKNNASE